MTRATLQEPQLSLRFIGPALESNRMDVRDIAPAMLAAGEALRAISRAVDPQQSEPRVEIAATEPGSFTVLLLLNYEDIWHRAVSLFTNNNVQAALNIGATAQLFGLSFQLVVRLFRSPIRAIDPAPPQSPPAVRITFADGTVMEVSQAALSIVQSAEIRGHLRDVVQPLRRDGITTLEVTNRIRRDLPATVVSNDDVSAFDVPAIGDELVGENEREVALQIAAVAFRENNKWRLTDGETTFFARIDDAAFLARVAKNEETFARNDILRVRLRTEQWRTAEGTLRSEYTVMNVVDHIHGPREVPLPFASPDEDEDDDLPF